MYTVKSTAMPDIGAKTSISKNYTVRLLYYAAAVCIYNAWCILNACSDNSGEEEDGRVIALEVKLSILLTFLIPCSDLGRRITLIRRYCQGYKRESSYHNSMISSTWRS